jgi:predicted amidohydrolase YtcJ
MITTGRCLAALCAVVLAYGCSKPAADTVFQNGRIYTVDAKRSWAEAVAIVDDRIVYVGGNDVAGKYIGPETRVIDLHGRMMLPGMQDAHVHPIEYGVDLAILNIIDLQTVDDYKVAIAEYAAANPELPWIIGTGWTFSAFGAGVAPQREILDELVPDRPVYIASYDDHAGWVNSKALEVAGITKDTPDPPGGQILRDPASGEPVGTLDEEARALVRQFTPPITIEEKIVGLREAIRVLNAWGITGYQDAGVDGDEELRVYKALEDGGELSMRVVAAMRWYPERGLEQVDELIALRDRYRSELIDAATAKLWQDGIMENYTAVMLEPYRIPSGSRGTPLIEPGSLKTITTQLDAAGFQVHFHAIGDGAVRQSLDAVAAAIAANGQLGHRHHVAHLQVIDPADIPRFHELEVIANFQPLWAQLDEYALNFNIPAIGEERARWLYPIRSVQDAGGMLAFGSDWSVTTANPFPQIETAVTRQASEGEPLPVFIPEERIDLASAIDAFTINAAYLNKREQDTGSIEAGKFADLIVVDQNLFEVEAAAISETKVLLTLFGGVPVYGELSGDFVK